MTERQNEETDNDKLLPGNYPDVDVPPDTKFTYPNPIRLRRAPQENVTLFEKRYLHVSGLVDEPSGEQK